MAARKSKASSGEPEETIEVQRICAAHIGRRVRFHGEDGSVVDAELRQFSADSMEATLWVLPLDWPAGVDGQPEEHTVSHSDKVEFLAW